MVETQPDVAAENAVASEAEAQKAEALKAEAQKAEAEETNVKIIKRYANRKLYDTERSCYVTLDEISQMVKEGEDVKVIDNKSKDDLTSVTLAQIIVEEEKRGSRMPLKLLRNIIKSSNEALGDFYQKRVADPAKQIASDVEERVGGIFAKKSEGETGSTAAEPGSDVNQDDAPASGSAEREAATTSSESTGQAQPTADQVLPTGEREEGAVRAFVNSTTEAFESWQKKIDEQVKETVAKMSPSHQGDAELTRLRERVKQLEARLAEVESAR